MRPWEDIGRPACVVERSTTRMNNARTSIPLSSLNNSFFLKNGLHCASFRISQICRKSGQTAVLSDSHHFLCSAYSADTRSPTAPHPDSWHWQWGVRSGRLLASARFSYSRPGVRRNPDFFHLPLPRLPGSHIQLRIPVCHIHKPLSISRHARCDPDLRGDGAWRAADVRACGELHGAPWRSRARAAVNDA